MRRLVGLGFVLLVIAGLSTSSTRSAQPPDKVHYQGVLRDAAGKARNGSFDMVFRFYDAPAGGNEILVDAHAGGGSVSVSRGLFSVKLGGGTVSDGTGPGTYGSLRDVFRDFGDVYLEIEVGGETLSPRVPVLAAPFAANADHLDGVDSSAFASAVHAHDAADITTGTVSNARLSTGSGGGLDADTVDGMHASAFVPVVTNVSIANKAVRQGATIVWESVSRIRIKPGILGFSDGKVRETTSDLIWDFANGVGPLGLDTGVEAPNTWYYLYAVPDAGDDETWTAVASTQAPTQSGGTGPAGYAIHRFIGSFKNLSTADIRPFRRAKDLVYWHSLPRARWLYVPGGPLPSVNVTVIVDASAELPATISGVAVDCYYDSYGAADTIFYIYNTFLCGDFGPNVGTGSVVVPTSSTRTFHYYASQTGPNDGSQATDLAYVGYLEDLSLF